MSKNKNIIVLGDIHSKWGLVNTLINNKKPEIILQVGDFGWWPHVHGEKEKYAVQTSQGWAWKYKTFDQYGLKMQDTVMHWCAGNHENFADLIIREKNGETKIVPNVTYMPFGTTLKLKDGRTVLFCGGAHSVDWKWRIEGVSWWKEEVITLEHLDKLPETHINIIISHTCPEEFLIQMNNKRIVTIDLSAPQEKDGSRHALSYVLNKYKPDLWYFGHWHTFCEGQFNSTRWMCLDMVGPSRQYWRYLK